jgi:hypothetical protein
MICADRSRNWHNRRAVSRFVVPGLVSPSRFGVLAAAPVSVAADDPGSTRTVYAMVVGLILVGVGFVVLGAWLIRRTRRDLDVLAPLELMGDGDWADQDPATQARMLDAIRPEGARPLRSAPSSPRVDTDFDHAPAVSSLDDLGPGLVDPARSDDAEAPGATRAVVDPTPIRIDSSAFWPEQPSDR